MLTLGKNDVMEYDSDTFDAYRYCDVPWEFQVDRLNASGLVKKDPVAAFAFLRVVYKARTPGGLNWTLWDLTSGFAENCKQGGPEFWEPLAGAGFCEFLERVVGDSSFFGESLYWVIEVLRQLEYALDFCIPRIYPLSPNPKREDFGVLNKTSRTIMAMCSNAWKNKDTFLAVRSQDGSAIRTSQPHHMNTTDLLKMLRKETGRLLLTYCCLLDCDGAYRQALARSPDFEDVQRLVLYFWFNYDDDKGSLVGGLLTVTTLHIESLEMTFTDMCKFGLEIFELYGPTFLSRLTRSLLETQLDDDTFVRMLGFIDKVLNIPEFRSHFASSGILKAVLVAFGRQGATTKLSRDELSEARVLINKPFTDVLVDTPAANGAIPLIRELHFISFLADSVVLATSLPGNIHSVYACIVNKLAAYGAGLAGRKGTNALGKAFSNAVRQVWYPTLIRLLPVLDAPSAAYDSEVFVRSWRNLGIAALLDEEEEKVEYERAKKSAAQHCAWRDCQYHTVKPPTPPRVCQGCGEAVRS
ncbi:hypothetical protein PENSPDRAFT_68561 [Peniophora sp. CONT]|nr:hypothetical protein PENSPDRAFT_68561 [Peniophora sp. CONT]